MRVWILEATPDYEQGERVGVYFTPTHAWEDLFKQVERKVFSSLLNFGVYVGADREADPKDPTRAIVLEVDYQWGDKITLRGEKVKGTEGEAPTLAEWRDLQQVGELLRQHATQVVGYTNIDALPERTLTGKWNFAHDD